MRLIKDIWAVVKNIWPTWKMQRYLSRVERNLKRMEKKHGVIGTFIKLLEETIADTNEETIQMILSDFVNYYESGEMGEVSETGQLKEDNLAVLKEYCVKYNVAFGGV